MNSNDDMSQADYEMVCAAQWNADPSVPVEDRFEEVYADETNDCTAGARARECAKSRDLVWTGPHNLQEDYARHGNAWPFSGDHLGTYDVREEYENGEQGDVIGRERIVKGAGVLWA